IHTTDVTATIDDGSGSTMNAISNATADLTVGNLDLEVVKGFVPQLVYGGANSTMSIILRNPNTSTALTGIQFTDNMFYSGTTPPPDYPAGEMILADPPNLDPSDCDPPSGAPAEMTGTAGTSTFTFSGGYLAAGAQCTITLSVTMVVNGNLTNTIPVGAVTSFNGAYNRTATAASLTNEAGASISKSFAPNPQSSGLNSYSILTLTIRNTTNVGLTGMGLVDDLPTTPAPGLQVAGGSAPLPTNGCGGTLSAPAGATVIQLSGGSLPVGFSSCTMTIPVTGAEPGVYTDTILPSQLTADQSPDVRQAAVATLTLTPYSLGNRVWYDTNDNGILDAGETGISGVQVNLYQDSGTTPGVFDAGDTFVASQTTDANGYYRFDNLGAGDYIVVIPASNFNTGGAPLAGYLSSGTSLAGTTISDSIGPSPNNDVDNDDNGTSTFNGLAINYVSSQAVTLGPGGSEPTGETDLPSPNPPGEAADNQSNLTVDFGFYRLQLGNQIYADINGDGTYESGTDSPLPGATVELFASDGTTQINVGPDGILGTADDAPGGVTSTAGSGGNYLFGGLPAGNYIVKVLPTGYPSTVDTYDSADTASPNTNADNNDNGVGTGVGTVSSNVVTLTPGDAGALSNNQVTNATGTTSNPTVDFGFLTSLGKKIVSTSSTYTTGSNVAIGETITYEVDMAVPAGATLTNVTLVDTPDPGLAFVDCISVTLPAGVTSTTYTGGACNTKDGTTPGSSNPLITNSGGNIAFDFGTVKSTASSSQVIQVQYSMIVLDILANQNGDSLANHAVWTRSGLADTISAAPVKIVEPRLTIKKSATPTSARTGATITFSIDIAHSAQSTEDALYEVVTDQIPAGLSFVTGSLEVSGTAPAPTSSNYDTPTHTLTLDWNDFPLGTTAHISFQAIYVGPGSAVNAASAQWTSLFIDPFPTPPSLSPYNTSATQRWYAPSAPGGADNYGASSSVTITRRSGGGNGNGGNGGGGQGGGGTSLEPVAPLTGFAPGRITRLPVQPADKSYQDLGDLWLEIPRLNVKLAIVGIPLNADGSWDLTWLGDQAGYLDGTAYPTHSGNSVITAHVYMSDGLPGPFVDLHTLKWGDQVIIHFAGQRYIYQVLENDLVSATDVSAFKHEDLPWITLITCKDYEASTDTYTHRVVVRAVLIQVQPDPSPGGK
ncbi:MAG TPA: sortase, partial [Anaerolineales bacterium]|nr:sortase [Anaerolineales bacterium]